MLPWVIIVVVVVALGLGLASLAESSAARWRGLVRELVPSELVARGGLTTMVADRHLVVGVGLAPAGIAYQTAARVLSRGTILAMLYQLGAEASERELRARLPLTRLGAATLRAQLEAFAALATALEALPMAEALTRRFIDLPTDTASHERLAAFELMLQWHPHAGEVIAACRNEIEHGGDAAIVERARQHLAHRPRLVITAP